MEVLKLLIGILNENKCYWKIEYCTDLALKYALPIHYEKITKCDVKFNECIIRLCCNGIRNEMEDVKNMTSQCLLSIIAVCDSDNEKDENVKHNLFNSLFSLNKIDEYTRSNIGISNILHYIFNEKNKYNNLMVGKGKEMFENTFNILLKFVNINHSNIQMKKQIIVTLHTFIEFIGNNNINIINMKELLSYWKVYLIGFCMNKIKKLRRVYNY